MLGLHQSNIYNSWKHNKESKFQIETTRVIIKQSGAETSGIHKATTKCIEKHSKLTTHWSKGSTPKSNSTSKVIPLMKHLPWIRFLDFEALALLRVKTLPVAFGCLVWSLKPTSSL